MVIRYLGLHALWQQVYLARQLWGLWDPSISGYEELEFGSYVRDGGMLEARRVLVWHRAASSMVICWTRYSYCAPCRVQKASKLLQSIRWMAVAYQLMRSTRTVNSVATASLYIDTSIVYTYGYQSGSRCLDPMSCCTPSTI